MHNSSNNKDLYASIDIGRRAELIPQLESRENILLSLEYILKKLNSIISIVPKICEEKGYQPQGEECKLDKVIKFYVPGQPDDFSLIASVVKENIRENANGNKLFYFYGYKFNTIVTKSLNSLQRDLEKSEVFLNTKKIFLFTSQLAILTAKQRCIFIDIVHKVIFDPAKKLTQFKISKKTGKKLCRFLGTCYKIEDQVEENKVNKFIFEQLKNHIKSEIEKKTEAGCKIKLEELELLTSYIYQYGSHWMDSYVFINHTDKWIYVRDCSESLDLTADDIKADDIKKEMSELAVDYSIYFQQEEIQVESDCAKYFADEIQTTPRVNLCAYLFAQIIIALTSYIEKYATLLFWLVGKVVSVENNLDNSTVLNQLELLQTALDIALSIFEKPFCKKTSLAGQDFFGRIVLSKYLIYSTLASITIVMGFFEHKGKNSSKDCDVEKYCKYALSEYDRLIENQEEDFKKFIDGYTDLCYVSQAESFFKTLELFALMEKDEEQNKINFAAYMHFVPKIIFLFWDIYNKKQSVKQELLKYLKDENREKAIIGLRMVYDLYQTLTLLKKFDYNRGYELYLMSKEPNLGQPESLSACDIANIIYVYKKDGGWFFCSQSVKENKRITNKRVEDILNNEAIAGAADENGCYILDREKVFSLKEVLLKDKLYKQHTYNKSLVVSLQEIKKAINEIWMKKVTEPLFLEDSFNSKSEENSKKVLPKNKVKKKKRKGGKNKKKNKGKDAPVVQNMRKNQEHDCMEKIEKNEEKRKEGGSQVRFFAKFKPKPQAMHASHQKKDAEGDINTVSISESNNVNSQISLAWQLFEQVKTKEALAKFKTLYRNEKNELKENKQRRAVLYGLIRCYERQNEYQQALNYFQPLFDIFPDDEKVAIDEIYCLEKLENYDLLCEKCNNYISNPESSNSFKKRISAIKERCLAPQQKQDINVDDKVEQVPFILERFNSKVMMLQSTSQECILLAQYYISCNLFVKAFRIFESLVNSEQNYISICNYLLFLLRHGQYIKDGFKSAVNYFVTFLEHKPIGNYYEYYTLLNLLFKYYSDFCDNNKSNSDEVSRSFVDEQLQKTKSDFIKNPYKMLVCISVLLENAGFMILSKQAEEKINWIAPQILAFCNEVLQESKDIIYCKFELIEFFFTKGNACDNLKILLQLKILPKFFPKLGEVLQNSEEKIFQDWFFNGFQETDRRVYVGESISKNVIFALLLSPEILCNDEERNIEDVVNNCLPSNDLFEKQRKSEIKTWLERFKKSFANFCEKDVTYKPKPQSLRVNL